MKEKKATVHLHHPHHPHQMMMTTVRKIVFMRRDQLSWNQGTSTILKMLKVTRKVGVDQKAQKTKKH